MDAKKWLGTVVLVVACSCTSPSGPPSQDYESCLIEGKIALIDGWSGQVQPVVAGNPSAKEKLKGSILSALWQTGQRRSHFEMRNDFENLKVTETVKTHCEPLK